MTWLISGKRPYFIACALLLMGVLCGAFYYSIQNVEEFLLREKAWEKRQDINLIAHIVDSLIEYHVDTNPYDYAVILQKAIAYIESDYYYTFAQLYDGDLNPVLPILSPGVGGGQKHNPLNYPAFIEAVNAREYGSLIYAYATPEAGEREIHMNFRWVPKDVGSTGRYLIAIAVSKYTILPSIDTTFIGFGIAIVVLATILIIIGMIMLTQVGYVFASRGGDDKWRNHQSLQ